MLFFYFGIGERDEQNDFDKRIEQKGETKGGDTIFGRIALMRAKLHLTDEELMNSSWIALNLELGDYPYFDYEAEKKISKEDTGLALEKLLKKQ